MTRYNSLNPNSNLLIFGLPLKEVCQYLFLAGIIFNVLFSIYLFNGTAVWKQIRPNAEGKYRGLSRANYESYLKAANLDWANSSAVFNEVENAVKQKNADLNPIGVSYFPAYIPEGTFLYHSNSYGLIPAVPEWVAMDYEFSYNFAHFKRPNRNRGHGPHKGPPEGGLPAGHPPGDRHGSNSSHLLTFKVNKPLDKLIYLGGASAAKTKTGEMDTQFLLSQLDDYDDFNERIGAKKICEWGNTNGRKLDGVVRLEVGFEIIICDFNDKLELVQNLSLTLPTAIVEFPEELPLETKAVAKRISENDEEKQRSKVIDLFENMSGYEHFYSGESVYDGDARIHLDFSKLITLINKTYISTDTYTRRISNISNEVNATLIKDMNYLLSGPEFDPFSSTNWEVVTHRIVKKFSPVLMVLNQTMNDYLIRYDKGNSVSNKTKQLENLDILSQNLSAYTFNFVRRYVDLHFDINSDEQIKDSENMLIWDYAHPYQPLKSDSDFLIWASITNVQKSIVQQVYEVFNLGKEILHAIYVNKDELKLLDDELHESIKTSSFKLNELLENLNWSIFYRCSQVCQYNEICFVPTWGPSPLGWGVNENLDTHHKTADGVTRINKDLICLSPQTLADAKQDF